MAIILKQKGVTNERCKKVEDQEKVFNEQLENYGVEFLDYYMLHNIVANSYKIAKGGTLAKVPEEYEKNNYNTIDEESGEDKDEENITSSNKKILVAYFSKTQNTQTIANLKKSINFNLLF